MSFNDVRDLSEHLKLLGYANLFPLQAFSTNSGTLASFHIVADILQWLADLLEPGTLLAGGIESQDQRVLLIHSAIEFFLIKAAIKLNPRKLYAASAVSAAELKKITAVLISPRNNDEEDSEEQNYHAMNQIDISDKMDNLRLARELSGDLTKRGAIMHELFGKEMKNKQSNNAEINKTLELVAVEKVLKNAHTSTQVKLTASHAQLENSKQELAALSSKLQRKTAELERNKQRLDALQKIRPAHIFEFGEYEKEISKLFEMYFLRVYVRDNLLMQMEERNKRSALLLSPIALHKPVENSMPLLPEGLLHEDTDISTNLNNNSEDNIELDSELLDIRDEDLLQSNADLFRDEGRTSGLTGRRRPGSAVQRKRPSARTGRQSIGLNNNYWTAAENEDSSFGSNSDLDMPENELVNTFQTQEQTAVKVDDSDVNSIDDISISKITAELPLRPKTANKQEHQSDEDF